MVDTFSKLRAKLAVLDNERQALQAQIDNLAPLHQPICADDAQTVQPLWDTARHGLNSEEVARYSRQIILPAFGVEGKEVPESSLQLD